MREEKADLIHFNPHSPCGERQSKFLFHNMDCWFQSTLPMRGATKIITIVAVKGKISIHTPHAGSDLIRFFIIYFIYYFNPHSPCGERLFYHFINSFLFYFNPHSPCGSDITGNLIANNTLTDFNPHSPCGERRSNTSFHADWAKISIHTPHAGSDADRSGTVVCQSDFNPHSPCGERRR